MKKNLPTIAKATLTILLFCLLGFGFYHILNSTGLLSKISSLKEIKIIILSAGFWSYLIFVLLQFLQVTFLPIPAAVTTIAGVLVFGPFITFILSTLSIILGSIFGYFLGKTFGTKLLFWIVGREKTEKFQKKLEKGKYIFFFMMLFPFFPDDILCMIAGMIDMNFKFFLTTNLITRPTGLFCLCFIGSGVLIPFHSWGILVWILIGILMIAGIALFAKNKQKIEKFFENFQLKHKQK